MTKDQFDRYNKIKKELKPLYGFLFWCGNRYRESTRKQHFSIIRNKKKWGLKASAMWDTNLKEIGNHELPEDLRERIITAMEDYVAEKEAELEAI